MLVLHANWHARGLHLWMESLDVARRTAAHGGPSAATAAANMPSGAAGSAEGTATAALGLHPFAVPAADLPQALASAGLTIGGAAASLPLLLPHEQDGRPAPSDRLGSFLTPASAQDGEAEVDLRLEMVEVPSVRVEGEAALAALLALDALDHGRSGVEPGHSLRWWGAVGRLALELLTEQRVIPTVSQDRSGSLVASWRPWLNDPGTTTRTAALLASMPAVVRAVEECESGDGWSLLEECLGTLVDAVVRQALIRENYLESIDGADPGRDPHVAWLAGLLGPETRVVPPEGPETSLFRAARHWMSELEDTGEGRPMRLLLQLLEPPPPLLPEADGHEDDQPWRLSFSLVSVETPPTVVSATDLWREVAGKSGARRTASSEQAAEILLAELGRASRLYPRLEEALEEGTPTGLDLDTRQAYEFLRDVMPILEESGVQVLAPDWWGQASSRLGARLLIDSDAPPDPTERGAQAGRRDFGLGSLVSYSWHIALGEQPLSLEAFQELAKRGTPLVRMGGRWVEIRREDLEGGLKFLQENPGGQATLLEALRLAQGADAKQPGIAVLGMDARGWVAEVFGPTSVSERLRIEEQPRRFQGNLRPYQLAGLSWLSFLDQYGLGGCLADDMGLGKTIQMIALLQLERERAPEGVRVGPTVLVCPMSVLGNWHRELTRFAPELQVHLHHGLERPQGEKFDRVVQNSDVVITTYALVTRDRETLARVDWRRVALDEAQHIKNPPTKQTTAIRSLKTQHRVALTGTPVENRLSELWSIMEFCAPGYLGTAPEFQRRFAVPIERHRDRDRAERLKELVRPFVLRRLKTDPNVITDLPPLVESRQNVPLTAEQAGLYDAVVEDMLKRVDRAEGIRRRGLVLSALVKLKQICNHPAHYLREGISGVAAVEDAEEQELQAEVGADAPPAPAPAAGAGRGGSGSTPGANGNGGPGAGGKPGVLEPADALGGRAVGALSARSGKSIRMMQMLEEVLAAGDRALIFTQYRQMGHLLVAMFRQELDVEALFLHGGTPQGKREQLVERFQSGDPSCPLFILSLKAGGVGLNLTAANHVFHYDRWWNPAVENQATDRAFRIGQLRTVNVHKMISSGTLEERIDQMIEQKTELASQIIGSGEQWLTELSTSQLRDLLTLRRNEMEEGA